MKLWDSITLSFRLALCFWENHCVWLFSLLRLALRYLSKSIFWKYFKQYFRRINLSRPKDMFNYFSVGKFYLDIWSKKERWSSSNGRWGWDKERDCRWKTKLFYTFVLLSCPLRCMCNIYNVYCIDINLCLIISNATWINHDICR